MSTLPQFFQRKKTKILEQLAVPETEYDDLSPKGSVDAGIRDLIDEINGREGLVTTSSCGGRVSVFLEGVKGPEVGENGNQERSNSNGNRAVAGKLAGVGGKGGGGRWLFVSHERIDLGIARDSFAKHLGMTRNEIGEFSMDIPSRLIHFKFEPMILHILTASLQHAQLVTTAAHQAGFRESGALNLTTTSSNESPTPMVAVRTMGLSLESIIGSSSNETEEFPICFVPEDYLKILIETANTRFVENTKRIERFRELLTELFSGFQKEVPRVKADGSPWEDAASRKERMRAEGLKRAEEAKLQKENRVVSHEWNDENKDD